MLYSVFGGNLGESPDLINEGEYQEDVSDPSKFWCLGMGL